MAVMARERWTDERLDKSFDRIDADLRELRVEMSRGFERIDDKLEAMQSETTARFEALQRNMTFWFVSLFSTIVACLVTALFAVISLT
jgi:hypothetical protein